MNSDGTFKSLPDLFAQHYTVVSLRVSTDAEQKTKTYKKLFKRLIQSHSLVLKQKQVIVGFEQDAISAFGEEFLGIVAKDCHFRFKFMVNANGPTTVHEDSYLSTKENKLR